MVKLTKDDVTFSKWDAADYLRTEKEIADYFEYVLSSGDSDMIVRALKTCAKARGRLNKTGKDTDISRTTLYRYLNGKSKLPFDKFLKIVGSLGITLKAIPAK